MLLTCERGGSHMVLCAFASPGLTCLCLYVQLALGVAHAANVLAIVALSVEFGAKFKLVRGPPCNSIAQPHACSASWCMSQSDFWTGLHALCRMPFH